MSFLAKKLLAKNRANESRTLRQNGNEISMKLFHSYCDCQFAHNIKCSWFVDFSKFYQGDDFRCVLPQCVWMTSGEFNTSNILVERQHQILFVLPNLNTHTLNAIQFHFIWQNHFCVSFAVQRCSHSTSKENDHFVGSWKRTAQISVDSSRFAGNETVYVPHVRCECVPKLNSNRIKP